MMSYYYVWLLVFRVDIFVNVLLEIFFCFIFLGVNRKFRFRKRSSYFIL